jgi:hypothetical protein
VLHQYNDFAEEIVENAENNAELIFGQIKGLATSITSHALALNQSWPFVTLPHFDIQTSQAGILAGSELIIFAPIVNEEDVHQWEQYAVGHQDWMVEDMVRAKSLDSLTTKTKQMFVIVRLTSTFAYPDRNIMAGTISSFKILGAVRSFFLSQAGAKMTSS